MTTSPPSPLRTQLSRWLAGLTAVRDAIGRLPTFPSALWLAGIAMIVAIRVRSVIRFCRRLRSGTPASPSVAALVARAAAKLELHRVPETIMVRDHISPMIWCGRKARLILPQKLWNELDDQGRRAVVYHELAHVRRKDHWVCWAESLVAAAYWWHPLVWWVRGKMRDEAENCCDAWVTWLLPRGRRAYAEALLKTRQFAGNTTGASAAPAIGMVTGKTKRFARRLTMIMTQQQTPRLSTTGIVLALSLIAAGCVATPARSDEPRVAETAPRAASDPVVAPTPPLPPVATSVVVVPTPPVSPLDSSVVVAPRSPRGHSGGRHDRDLAERMERLERQLEKLAARLEKTGSRARSSKAAPPSKTWRSLITGESGSSTSRYALAPPSFPEREIVETYRLPKGQLEALTRLMVLPDVPIRVRPREDAIEVYGTQADHARFKAFIGLLSDKKSAEAYHLPPGQLKALTALMALDDVPVMIQPGSDAITVHGTPAVQAVFQAFVKMIQPAKDGRQGRVGASRGSRAREEIMSDGVKAIKKASRVLKETLAHRNNAAARLGQQTARREISVKTLTLTALLVELKAELLGRKIQVERLEAQADELQSQAETVLAQAEFAHRSVSEAEEQVEKLAERLEESVERGNEAMEEAIEAAEEDADDDDGDDDD